MIYKNVLPPLSLLRKNDYQDLERNLISLNFKN
jgi:4-hydroxy-tetrahydrodipicolinate synthase